MLYPLCQWRHWMQTSDMLIWTTADPYNGANTTAQLNAFQAQTSSINGNLGHLVEVQNIGGLAAGFSGICAANGQQSLFQWFFRNQLQYSSYLLFQRDDHHPRNGPLIGLPSYPCLCLEWEQHGDHGCAGFTEGGCPLPFTSWWRNYYDSIATTILLGWFYSRFWAATNAVIVNTVNTPGNCLLGSCSAAPAKRPLCQCRTHQLRTNPYGEIPLWPLSMV